jgi:hypothetical protein
MWPSPPAMQAGCRPAWLSDCACWLPPWLPDPVSETGAGVDASAECRDVGAHDVDAADLAVLDLGDVGPGHTKRMGQLGLRYPGVVRISASWWPRTYASWCSRAADLPAACSSLVRGSSLLALAWFRARRGPARMTAARWTSPGMLISAQANAEAGGGKSQQHLTRCGERCDLGCRESLELG